MAKAAYCHFCGANTGFDNDCPKCGRTPVVELGNWDATPLSAGTTYRKYVEMGAWCAQELAALDALLDEVESDPAGVLRECDRIRNLGWCMHSVVWDTLDALSALAREELNGSREYWKDADVSDVFPRAALVG